MAITKVYFSPPACAEFIFIHFLPRPLQTDDVISIDRLRRKISLRRVSHSRVLNNGFGSIIISILGFIFSMYTRQKRYANPGYKVKTHFEFF